TTTALPSTTLFRSRPPTDQGRIGRAAPEDMAQLILAARNGGQIEQRLTVVERQEPGAGVGQQRVIDHRHLIAVNLPRAKICNGTVITAIGVLEAVGVNEICGEAI